MSALLEVERLTVQFNTAFGNILAVDEFDLTVRSGECVGIVGESGAGKSQLLHAIMGLLPRNARVSGSVRLNGGELLNLRERDRNALRGRQVAMVFQDPLSSLTPHLRIGTQICEVIMAHERVTKRAARARARALLEQAGVPDAMQRMQAFPHQLSGGLCQRAMIAMAIACGPSLLIADEPTTALDVTVQAQILDLLRRLSRDHNTAIVLVSHDLGVVATLADQLIVMYAGRAVEQGALATVLQAPAHPYTRGLVGATPHIDTPKQALAQIPGNPPILFERPTGCAFAPRCAFHAPRCDTARPLLRAIEDASTSAAHYVACIRAPVDGR